MLKSVDSIAFLMIFFKKSFFFLLLYVFRYSDFFWFLLQCQFHENVEQFSKRLLKFLNWNWLWKKKFHLKKNSLFCSQRFYQFQQFRSFFSNAFVNFKKQNLFKQMFKCSKFRWLNSFFRFHRDQLFSSFFKISIIMFRWRCLRK